MIVAAEFGTGEVLWTVVAIAALVLWFTLVLQVFAHIVMNAQLSGWGKALWVIAVIFMPFLGILLYLIINGGDQTLQPRSRPAPVTDETVGELERIRDLWSAGALTDDEYERARSRVASG